jgi:DNA-binding GntR family transcriptional regulator
MSATSDSAATTDGLNALIDQIARDIQAGTLAPGMWLKQIDLERNYGASRPDVRRALDRLVEKRLVRHVPNRGYHVFETDDRQVAEALEIRLILETAVAEKIVAHADEASLQRLTRLAQHYDLLARRGTLLDLYDANLAFHHELLRLAGNAELLNVIADLRYRTSSAVGSQWRRPGRIEQSGREHHAMIEAIAERSSERLRALIANHIRQPVDEETPATTGSR